jgi:arabinose-5-phosphate isomerase
VAALCQKIIDCKGTTLFTGVGKTSFVAKKVCQTLASTGTRSIFLNAVDALHGDIGVVRGGDVLVMLSESGETHELVTLLPYAKAKGAFVVACTNAPNSTLAGRADAHVRVPGDGDVARPISQQKSLERRKSIDAVSAAPPPVTYTALQLLFGDTCAVYLMELKGLTKNQYALNHPAGRIGKRLVLRVGDVMKPWSELPLCSPETNGADALVRMAGTSKGYGCLLVVDEQRRLLGTFSDADLRRALTRIGESVLLMTTRELMNFGKGAFPRATTPSAMAFDAHVTMEAGNPVEYLPVISEDGEKTLLGLVTTRDLAECGMS